jgi:hypothetical protein
MDIPPAVNIARVAGRVKPREVRQILIDESLVVTPEGLHERWWQRLFDYDVAKFVRTHL